MIGVRITISYASSATPVALAIRKARPVRGTVHQGSGTRDRRETACEVSGSASSDESSRIRSAMRRQNAI